MIRSRLWVVAVAVLAIVAAACAADSDSGLGEVLSVGGEWTTSDGAVALEFVEDGLTVRLTTGHFEECENDYAVAEEVIEVVFMCQSDVEVYSAEWLLADLRTLGVGESAAGPEQAGLVIDSISEDDVSTVSFEDYEGETLEPVDEFVADAAMAASNDYQGQCNLRAYNGAEVVDCQLGSLGSSIKVETLLLNAQAVDASITADTPVWVAAIGARGARGKSGYVPSNGAGGAKGTALTVTTINDLIALAEVGYSGDPGADVALFFLAVGKTQNQEWGTMSGFGGSGTTAWIGSGNGASISEDNLLVSAGGGGGGGQASGLASGGDGGAGGAAADNGQASEGKDTSDGKGFRGSGADGRGWDPGGGGGGGKQNCGGKGGQKNEIGSDARNGKCGWGGGGGAGCKASVNSRQKPGFRNDVTAVRDELTGDGGNCAGGPVLDYPGGGGGGGWGGGASGRSEAGGSFGGSGGGGGGSWARRAATTDPAAPIDRETIDSFVNISNAHSGRDGHLHLIFNIS
jgi:hypothetical protein